MAAPLAVDPASGAPVVVFGATGRTGVLVVKELLQRNIRCRAFVRNAQKAAAALPEHDRLEIFQGNVCDEDALGKALDGAQAAIWAATGDMVPFGLGYLWKDSVASSTPYSVDWLGVKRLVDVLKAKQGSGGSSIRRVVFLSGGLAGRVNPIAVVMNVVSGGGAYYKGLSEAYLMESGLPYTIVRPAGGLHDRPIEAAPGQATMPKMAPSTASEYGPIGRELSAWVLCESLVQPAAANVSFNLIDGPATDRAQLTPTFVESLQRIAAAESTEGGSQ